VKVLISLAIRVPENRQLHRFDILKGQRLYPNLTGQYFAGFVNSLLSIKMDQYPWLGHEYVSEA